nr:hypothetical protein Q903MT_gene594 [Picea sitchensis]
MESRRMLSIIASTYFPPYYGYRSGSNDGSPMLVPVKPFFSSLVRGRCGDLIYTHSIDCFFSACNGLI